jgi:thymidylate kinase
MKIIEFLGTARAGKTEQIRLLRKHLEKKKLKVGIIEDRDIEKHVRCPLDLGFEYNMIHFNLVFQRMIELSQTHDVIILDRGFTDAKVWFDVEKKKKHASSEQHKFACEYMKFLENRYVHFKILLHVEPKTSLERNETKGEISATDDYCMNEIYLTQMYKAYQPIKKRLFKEKNSIVLDGNDDLMEIHKKILKRLKDNKII